MPMSLDSLRRRPKSYIAYEADPLPGGRAVLRRDLVLDGRVIESRPAGSPAPIESVKKHERKVVLPC